MYSNIYFYYANIDGLSKKSRQSKYVMSEHNPHIAYLFKAELSHNVKSNIPGYYIFLKK